MHENGTIEHTGKVIQVYPGSVVVAVEAETACAGCHARSICGSGNDRQKEITVVTDNAPYYVPGEEVVVSVSRAMGMKAVTVAYIVPFLVVFTVLLVLLQAGAGELVAGSVSLGLLCLYYLGLYLFRSKISREITFNIRKTGL